jgi:hypothetical protein
MTTTIFPSRSTNLCYFGRDHPGTYRSCCGKYMCDYHAARIDLRALAGGYELAKSVLNRLNFTNRR